MALPIPRQIVEYVLLGPATGRRQLQELSDPRRRLDRLCAGARQGAGTADHAEPPRACRGGGRGHRSAGRQASARRGGYRTAPECDRRAAHLRGGPSDHRADDDLVAGGTGSGAIQQLQRPADRPQAHPGCRQDPGLDREELEAGRVDRRGRDEHLPVLDRLVGLAALILWSGQQGERAEGEGRAEFTNADLDAYLGEDSEEAIVQMIADLFERIEAAPKSGELVFQVSLNRAATPCIERSVPAVKADAARGLFEVNCKNIVWAVVDSGIYRRSLRVQGQGRGLEGCRKLRLHRHPQDRQPRQRQDLRAQRQEREGCKEQTPRRTAGRQDLEEPTLTRRRRAFSQEPCRGCPEPAGDPLGVGAALRRDQARDQTRGKRPRHACRWHHRRFRQVGAARPQG